MPLHRNKENKMTINTYSRQIHFGTILQGAGGNMSAWRHPDAIANASINLDFVKNIAIQAEQAKFDFVFIADGLYINEKSIPHFLNRFEPITLLSALASVTQKIGLVGTVSTSYSEPFNVARQFASLDHISGGRAGWNVVTTPLEGTSKNFNNKPHPAHQQRYEIADEYLDVVKGLWDSWEDHAFVRNKETGKFFDPNKLHAIQHTGKYFQVHGPLNIERTPQDRPIVFQAGASISGQDLAAKHADAIFTHQHNRVEAKAFYRSVKEKLKSYGRHENDLLIFQGIGVLIGQDQSDIERQYQQMTTLVSIENALDYLGRFFEHHDFSRYELDAPFPDLGTLGENSFRSTTDEIKRVAKENGYSLRQTALAWATPKPPFTGTPLEIANQLEEWFEENAADGFIIQGATPNTLTQFIQQVIPILQKKGLYRTEYLGTTLRENLQLSRPNNQFQTIQQKEKIA